MKKYMPVFVRANGNRGGWGRQKNGPAGHFFAGQGRQTHASSQASPMGAYKSDFKSVGIAYPFAFIVSLDTLTVHAGHYNKAGLTNPHLLK